MSEKVEIAFNNDWSLEQLKDKVVETPGLRLSGQRKWPNNSPKSTGLDSRLDDLMNEEDRVEPNTVDKGTCIYCGDEVWTRTDGKSASSHVDWGPEDSGEYGEKPCNGTGRYVKEVRKDDVEVGRE